MATILVKNKGGLRLKFETSTRSKPRIRQAYPIPDFPDATTSLLSLALETVIQTGRKGIRVVSTPDILPGGADAVWKLFHAAYQGTLPDPLAYEEIPVQAPKINLLVDPALPKATHKFYLQREEGGKVYTYTETSIATPDDAVAPLSLEGILADDLITASEKTAFKGYYDAIIADQTILDAQADSAGSSRTAYDAAITALTAAVSAISPAYTNLVVDSPVSTGASLLALFRTVYSTRDALRVDIARLEGSDSYLTPTKKRDVKAQWTRIKLEQATLDTAADVAGISRTTYDTAITTLYTYLDGLTDVGGAAGGAWTGSTSAGDWASYSVACGVTGTTLRADLAAVYSARDALLVALGATGLLDDLITGPQKVIIKADRDRYYNGFYTATTGLKAQAVAAGVSWTACDTAIAALETHLGTYTSANGWNTSTHDWKNLNTLVLSAGGGATLRTKIADVVTQWNALSGSVIGALSTAAINALAAAPALVSSLPTTCGAEYITATNNRTFAGAGNWTGTNWTVSGGAFVHTAGANVATLPNANLTAAPANGEGFQISLDITTTTGGTLTIAFGGVSAAVITLTPGVYTDCIVGITATGAGSGLTITPDASWVGSIDNVSVKKTQSPGGSYPHGKLVWLTANWTDSGGVVGPAGKVWPSTIYKADLTGGVWMWKVGATMADQIIGKLVAGQISAGAIGVNALAALLAIVGVIQSNNYVAGTSGAAATGFKLSGVTFTVTYLGGATSANCQAEFGGDVSIAGRKAAVIVDKLWGNSTSWSGAGTNDWICPEGITEVELTLQAPGGNGATGAGTGGTGGQYIRRKVTVKPHNTYRVTNGAVGSNSTFAWLSFDGATGFTTDSGFTTITATCGANGTGGAFTGVKGDSAANPYETPEDGWTILGATGGDSASAGAGPAGDGGDVGTKTGGSGASAIGWDGGGGGGASAMANGGLGALNRNHATGVAAAGTLGSGGGSGYTPGAGGPAFARIRH